jgi:hypothetical protein
MLGIGPASAPSGRTGMVPGRAGGMAPGRIPGIREGRIEPGGPGDTPWAGIEAPVARGTAGAPVTIGSGVAGPDDESMLISP